MATGRKQIALLACLLCCASLTNPANCDVASVTYSTVGGYALHTGKADGWVAWGNFTDGIATSGWGYLEVTTDEESADDVQAYAAGLVEGFLTRHLIAMHWNNTVYGYCTPDASSDYCQRLKQFLDTNFNDYVQTSLKLYSKTSPYWHQVELFIDQLKGLEDGYAGMPKMPSWIVQPFGFLMFQVSGDTEDLEEVLQKPDKTRVLGSGSCSALVKLLPGNTDLLLSQDTWSTYQSMLRILKKYDFGFHELDSVKEKTVIPGRVMTFSSYPGVLMSGDDFYLLSSGLAAFETTIGNSNPNLWQYVRPWGTVMEGIRAQIANRLAVTGKGWADTFSEYNSGTYNNEWLVVDYKQFTPGQSPVSPGLLTILDQLPGLIHYDDVSDLLESQQYFPSYNSPYFEDIFNASGIPALVEKYGDWFTHEHTPRALIFRRDHVNVVDAQSMLKLMRYNDYTHDPLSQCNCTPPYSAENAISARSDLNPADGTYPFGALGHRSHGGIDSKVTNSEMFKSLQFIAIAGPTYGPLPPFQWSKSDFASTTPHEGHPDIFQFDPVQYEWDLNHK